MSVAFRSKSVSIVDPPTRSKAQARQPSPDRRVGFRTGGTLASSGAANGDHAPSPATRRDGSGGGCLKQPSSNGYRSGPASGSSSGPSADEASLQAPFPALASGLTSDDLRECAYEMLVGIVGARGPVRTASSAGRRRGIISDEMKVVLNLRVSSDDAAAAAAGDGGAPSGPLDVVRRQLDISEFSDARTRKALTRVAAAQPNKKPESLIVPLELLCDLGATDFPSQREYQRWKRRQLLALEEGLLNHPVRGGAWTPSTATERDISREKEKERERAAAAEQRLRKVLSDIQNGRAEVQDAAVKKELREAALGVAERPLPAGGGGSKAVDVHWVDGTPYSVRLYAALLGAGFTGGKATTMVEQLEDVLEVLGRVWPAVGMCPLVHRAVFGWLFLRQYVASGEKEPALLIAADYQLKAVLDEVKGDFASEGELTQEVQAATLLTLLPHLQEAGQARMTGCHDTFPEGVMAPGLESLVGVVMRASEALQHPHVQKVVARLEAKGRMPVVPRLAARAMSASPAERVEGWVRSSVRAAFAKTREAAAQRQVSFKGGSGVAPPMLVTLAADAGVLAMDVLDKYVPALRPWHANAGGIAVATVHACYRAELKHFLNDRPVISVEVTQVLLQAEKLEKQLIEMAVEEGENSDDGGAEVIQEMAPYETHKTIDAMLQTWQDGRLEKFDDWVDRALHMEKWDAKAAKAFCAASVVDVLGLMDEAQEAFFALPIPPRHEMLVALVKGMENALIKYCQGALATAGNKDALVPPLPPLTRFKKDNAGPGAPGPVEVVGPKPQTGRTGKDGKERSPVASLPRLVVRINTLHHIAKEVDGLSSRIRSAWESALAPPTPRSVTPSGSKGSGGFWSLPSFSRASSAPEPNVPLVPPLPTELLDMFASVREETERGIALLCEMAAYRVVYRDLRDAVLERLYGGGVGVGMRLGALLEQMHPHLVTIADTVHTGMRDRLVLQLLKALVHAYLRTLLAGGPNRVYMVSDVAALQQDLGYLAELFVDGGDGVPQADVDAVMAPASAIVAVMGKDTDELMRLFEAAQKQATGKAPAAGAGGAVSLPPVPAEWSAGDANTLLRVLCYRGDKKASKYLKKLFDLPKEVAKRPWY